MTNNAASTASTGPRTEEGKARSSQNATKTGLFAARDYILASEHEEYALTLTSLRTDLRPEGILEETFLAEIMSATWRLRRCRLLEAESQDEAPQKSIDRARAQSHTILRRSLAELRKLQTERAIRAELDHSHLPGLADSRQLLSAIKTHDRHHAWQAKSAPQSDPNHILQQLAFADAALGMSTPSSSFCKPAVNPSVKPSGLPPLSDFSAAHLAAALRR